MLKVIGHKVETIPTRPDFEIWKLRNNHYLCLMAGTIIRDWATAHAQGLNAPPTAFRTLHEARERLGDLALMVANGNRDLTAAARLKEWASKIGVQIHV